MRANKLLYSSHPEDIRVNLSGLGCVLIAIVRMPPFGNGMIFAKASDIGARMMPGQMALTVMLSAAALVSDCVRLMTAAFDA